MKAKSCLFILITILIVTSCINFFDEQRDRIPNLFKHCMKGKVESVFTQTYAFRNGIKEEYPKHYAFLLGDKFSECCSRKKYDKAGNLLEETTYHDWATYTDSTIVSYKYENFRLSSSFFKVHSREYSTPTLEYFEYSVDGGITKWGDKVIKLNEDKQISEIHSSIRVYNFDIYRIEEFNNEGSMIAMYDSRTKKMEVLNTFDKSGNIIKQQQFNPQSLIIRSDTIIYTDFDKKGNWIQRKRIDLERHDTIIQYRTVNYFVE